MSTRKSARTSAAVATPAPALPAAVRHRAEQLCVNAGERLTAARLNAYAELFAQPRPVSAYELLDLLEQRQGRKLAPLTVYRHLDFLIRVGLIHKLASTQSYMACDHPDHPHDSLYLVCSSCGKADELESDHVNQLLVKAASSHGFKSAKRIVEIQGVCQDCGTQPEQ